MFTLNSYRVTFVLLLTLVGLSAAVSDIGGANSTNCTSFETVFAEGSTEYRYCNCQETASAENIPLGIFLIICGSVSLNMGNNIMSLGHRQEAEEKDKAENPDGESEGVGGGGETAKGAVGLESPSDLVLASPATPFNSVSGGGGEKVKEYVPMTPSPGGEGDGEDLNADELTTPESVEVSGKERRIRKSMDKARQRKKSIGVPLAGPAAGASDIVEFLEQNLSQLPKQGMDGFNLMGQAGAAGAGVLRDSLQGAASLTRDMATGGGNGAVVHMEPKSRESSKVPPINVNNTAPPQLLHSQSAPTTPSNPNINDILVTPRETKSGESNEETDVEAGNEVSRVGGGEGGVDGGKTKEGAEEEEPPKKNFTWFIGTVIFVSGSLLTFGSFGFAPQSILAPMECSQFVSNVFFARIILGEKVTRRQIVGTAALILGIICIIIAHTEASKGKESSHRLDAEEMVVYFSSEGTAFWIYMMAAGGLLVVSHTTFLKYRAAKARGETLYRHGLIEPGCFSIVSALVGTVSLLFVKCISELLIKTLDTECGENQFTHWFTYVAIICWIPTVSFWLSRMNWGLALYSPLLVIPLLQCGFVFFAILIGGIYFHEFNALIQSPYLALFIGGVGGMFYGVFLLAPKDGMH
ncbi:hypothetical protein TrVE_jg14046 [Triparma verrucosa]|uniref:Uncharacterized protein n=1 Tax=Triparma verrucosa TaxID=1606542 RepID=A0A9W7BUP2_9STRA|nr:hypothetical protein TrVE_jg14046 [Triparma verrucosa]